MQSHPGIELVSPCPFPTDDNHYTTGTSSVGQPARTYLQHHCANIGCSLEDLIATMDDSDRERERERERERACVRKICAINATWWWWWWYIFASFLFPRMYTHIIFTFNRISELTFSWPNIATFISMADLFTDILLTCLMIEAIFPFATWDFMKKLRRPDFIV